MRSSILGGSAVALAAAIAMWGCGGGGGGSTPAPSPTPATPPTPTPNAIGVSIVGSAGNTAYQPNPVKASQGDTINFKNNDATTHHVVMDDGSVDLGEINPGQTKSMTLKSSGGNFHCILHSSMVGSINGAVAPDPPPCNDPYGYGC